MPTCLRVQWFVWLPSFVLLLCGAGSVCAAGDLAFAVARLPLSLPVYVAEAKGYFDAEKLQVKTVDCEIGRQCLDLLLDGKTQLATTADAPIVISSLRGARFAILATIATTRNNKIVTRRGRGITSIADLADRRVGTFVGTSAHYFLELNLLSSGIDPARVVVLPIQPADAAKAFASEAVDAVVVFEPFALNVVRALGAQAQVVPSRRLPADTWNVVVADALSGQRELELQGLCRALDRAMLFIASEPAQAREILRRRLGLDDAALEWVWKDTHYALELRQSLVTGLEGQTRWALRSGHATGTKPNYLEYIRMGPLSAVRPGAVSIVR